MADLPELIARIEGGLKNLEQYRPPADVPFDVRKKYWERAERAELRLVDDLSRRFGAQARALPQNGYLYTFALARIRTSSTSSYAGALQNWLKQAKRRVQP